MVMLVRYSYRIEDERKYVIKEDLETGEVLRKRIYPHSKTKRPGEWEQVEKECLLLSHRGLIGKIKPKGDKENDSKNYKSNSS